MMKACTAVLPSKKLVWLMLIVFSLLLESVALIYQYVLDYPPCVVCIQIRILLVAMIVISLIGLLLRAYMPSRFVGLIGLVSCEWCFYRALLDVIGHRAGLYFWQLWF